MIEGLYMLTTAERMEHMPFSGIRVVMEKATQMAPAGNMSSIWNWDVLILTHLR